MLEPDPTVIVQSQERGAPQPVFAQKLPDDDGIEQPVGKFRSQTVPGPKSAVSLEPGQVLGKTDLHRPKRAPFFADNPADPVMGLGHVPDRAPVSAKPAALQGRKLRYQIATARIGVG